MRYFTPFFRDWSKRIDCKKFGGNRVKFDWWSCYWFFRGIPACPDSRRRFRRGFKRRRLVHFSDFY